MSRTPLCKNIKQTPLFTSGTPKLYILSPPWGMPPGAVQLSEVLVSKQTKQLF